jgi:hypothetical protein
MTSPSPSIICAFDIGIKNLAFCVFDGTAKKPIAWANVNILPDSEKEKPRSCSQCKSAAKYEVPGNAVKCKKHLGTALILPGGETKIPLLKDLKAVVKNNALQAAGQTRDALLIALKTKFAIPLEKPKKVAATHQPISILHDGILKMIDENWSHFQKVGRFALENQPVLKNPTMKTVQILLFASLRQAFIGRSLAAPQVDLVHAGKKVKGVAAGDAGYADRKAGSEARSEAWLTSYAPEWLPVLTDAKKKSDLADALCMCLDLSAV